METGGGKQARRPFSGLAFEEAFVIRSSASAKNKDQKRSSRLVPALTAALAMLLIPALAGARSTPRAQTQQPLGSLNTVGQVYVGGTVAPANATVMTGDTVKTDPTSTATFTMGGKGSLQIAANTELLFVGSQQYVAQLKSGIVVMNSLGGPAGISLRAGNFVVVGVTQDQPSTARIEAGSDGSFRVSCLSGSVGVVPIEGAPNGNFLQPGQSVTISPQGELSAPTATVATAAPPEAQPTTPQPAAKSKTPWIILGVAAAGGGIGAAVALSHSSSSVSPSAP
jgi:ferric-dicitrate binding protein FerR (iron transport regulator)